MQKCPKLQENWGFYTVGLKFATRRSKSGFQKKGQNLLLVRRPSSFLSFSVSRLVFAKKRCFQNRRNFAETTENVVPNWRGRKTQFLHPRVRNRLSWSGQRNGPDTFVAAFSFLSHSPSRRQGQLFDISCCFPS